MPLTDEGSHKTENPCYPCTVLILLVTVSIIGCNIITLLVVARSKRLRSNAGFLMGQLAVVDLCVGIMTSSFAVLSSALGRWPYGDGLCGFVGFCTCFFCSVSIMTLMQMSVDRYVQISRPLHYAATMTIKRHVTFTTILVLVFALFFSTPFYGWGEYVYQPNAYICAFHFDVSMTFSLTCFLVIVSPQSVVIVTTYVKLYKIARRHISSINNTEETVGSNATNTKLKQQFKLVKTIGIVVGLFHICWMPAATFQLLTSFMPVLHHGTPDWLDFTMWWLAIGNSFFNFIVYTVNNKEFREELRKLKNSFCPNNTIDDIVGEVTHTEIQHATVSFKA